MKRIGATLLALAACNQVFGIKDTGKLPDAADPMFIGHMNWVAPAGSGTEVFPIGGEAIDSTGLMLEIGSGAGSGTDTLAPVAYDSATGAFNLGFKLAGQAWRLVYTLPGDTISHEYQWNIQTPDLLVPRMTRKGATPVPPDSGYDITTGTAFTVPIVTVSGANTFAYPTSYSGGNVQFSYSNEAQPILGPLSAPDPSDFMLVLDRVTQSSTPLRTGVIGYAVVSSAPALAANTLTPVNPTWTTATQVSIRPAQTQPTQLTRLVNALRTLAQNDSGTQLAAYPHMTYGLSPSLAVYGFRPARPECGAQLTDKSLEGLDCLSTPAIIALDDDAAFDQTLQVPDLSSVPFATIMYERYTIPRETHGVAIASAIQTMVTAPNPPTAGENIDAFSNTIPSAILVDGMHLDNADISGATGPASMDVSVAAGPQPRLLSFNPRLGQDGALMARADDYTVTLWQIQNPDSPAAKLHTVRIFHVLDASHGVYIEGPLLQPGLYVFSITARVGFPMSSQGNFRTITFPLSESTVFTRQFRVQ